MGKTQKSGPERRRFAECGRTCLPETRLFTDPPQPQFTKSSEDSDRLCEMDKAPAMGSLDPGKETPSGLVSPQADTAVSCQSKWKYNQNGVILLLGTEAGESTEVLGHPEFSKF